MNGLNTPAASTAGSGLTWDTSLYVNLTSSIAGNGTGITASNFTGGSDFNNGVPKISFKLHTLADGDILNNSASIGANSILTDGNQNNVRWEISSLNQKKGTFTLLI